MTTAELISLYRTTRTTLLTCRRHRVQPADSFRDTVQEIGEMLEREIGTEEFETLMKEIDHDFTR